MEQLALIDENGRFSSIRRPLGKFTPEEIEKRYDNALFQTGRLITGGLYIQIILKDYVRTILNLNRTDSKWDLDPRSADGKALFGEGAGEAGGNQVSAEFNLVYRWHSCISRKDEEWTNDLYQQMFPDAQSRNLADIVKRLSDFGKSVPRDPLERRFANLTRTKSGSYEDGDLASIFAASVEDVAGAFGANQVPEILRDVEILGIMQARSWKLASLCDFTTILISSSCILVWLWKMPNIQRRRAAASVQATPYREQSFLMRWPLFVVIGFTPWIIHRRISQTGASPKPIRI